MSKKPNILVIFTDEQRFDTMAAYGNNYIKTPNLDKLASEGIVYDTCITPCPLCTPARIAAITGFAPSYFGCLGNEAPVKNPPSEESLPNHLKKAGYQSFAVGKLHYSNIPKDQMYGFDGGLIVEEDRGLRMAKSADSIVFDDYDKFLAENKAYGWAVPSSHGQNEIKPEISPLPKELHSTRWVSDNTIDYIKNKRDKDKPFFLFSSFVKPHSPYDFPQHLTDLYDIDELPEMWVSEKDGCAKNPIFAEIRKDRQFDLYSDYAYKKSKAAYYANITFIDEEIGRIMQTLKDEGIDEDTLVIFTADHGDLTGDHNMWFKNFGFEGSARVPLLVRWTGKTKPGSRCFELTTLTDIFPTVMEAVGLDFDRTNRFGKNLLSLKGAGGQEERDFVVSEHGMYPKHLTHVRTKKWKYLHYQNGGFEQLFDLENDPHELCDLSEDKNYDEIKRTLRRGAVEWITRWGDPQYSVIDNDLSQTEEYIKGTGPKAPSYGFAKCAWMSVDAPEYAQKKNWFWSMGYRDWYDIIKKLMEK